MSCFLPTGASVVSAEEEAEETAVRVVLAKVAEMVPEVAAEAEVLVAASAEAVASAAAAEECNT